MPETAALVETDPNDTREWEQLLCRGALEVFAKMIGLPLNRCREGAPYKAGEYTAVVGLAGPIHGVFAIQCNERTACGIASGMLGVDAKEARAEVWDALGEVCNMVAGNFKNQAGKLGEQSVLSVPTVIRGLDYRVRPLVNGSAAECLMETADGVVRFRLDYKLASAQ